MKHPIDIVPSPPALSRPQSESIAGEVVTYDAAQIVRLTAKYLGHEPHGTMRELARLLAIHPRTITRALRACGTDFACQKRLAQRASEAASEVGRQIAERVSGVGTHIVDRVAVNSWSVWLKPPPVIL